MSYFGVYSRRRRCVFIMDHAIPYCREGLDYVTCTTVSRSSFQSVRFGLMISERPKRANMNFMVTKVDGRKRFGY